MDVIQTLRQQAAQDHEALRARGVMIEILAEAVGRLQMAGYTPRLDLGDCNALVVLRLDTSAWALRQVGRVLDAEPVPVVKDSLTVATASVPEPDPAPVAAAAPVARVPVAAKAGPAVFPPLFWTPERDAQLLALRGTMAAREIAAQMGTTEGAVHNRFSKLRVRGVDLGAAKRQEYHHFATPSVRADGVVLRAWTDADDEAIIAGYGNADLPLARLAKQLDRSHSALTKRITHLRNNGRIVAHRGIVPSQNKWSAARLQRFRELFPVTPAAEIAAEFGVSKGAISGMAHRLGLGSGFRGVTKGAVAKPAPQPAPVVTAAPPVLAKVEQKSEPVSEPVAPSVPVADPAPGLVARGGGNFVPAMARAAVIAQAPAKMFPGMTQGEKEALIAQHVDGLPAHAEFDAELDLELCEAVFGGKGGLALFATDVGLDHRVALARFDAIVAPFRAGGGKGLPIEAAGLILPALRKRVARARGVAA